MNLEQAIRERAYFIWLDGDRLDGNADAHWLAAETELVAEAEASMETVARLMSTCEAMQDNEPGVAKPKAKRRVASKRSSVNGGRLQVSSAPTAPRKISKRPSRVPTELLN
jgi:hypothetical protein